MMTMYDTTSDDDDDNYVCDIHVAELVKLSKHEVPTILEQALFPAT